MEHLRNLGPGRKPLRDGQRALLMLGEADRHGAQAAAAEPGIVGRRHLPQLITDVAQRRIMAGRGGYRPQHHVAMADDVFRRGEDGEVDALLDRREEQRRRPGVVEHGGQPVALGDGDDRGQVLHLEGQAARAFEEDRLGGGADQLFDPRADQRIVEAGGDAEPLQQLHRLSPRRVIGAVDQQQFVARRQDGQQRRGDRRNARGVEERRLRPRLQARQRIGEAPLRRRTAAAVIEAVVRVAMSVGAQIGDVVVEDGRGAPDRRIDDPGGPFGAAARLDDARGVAQASFRGGFVVGVTRQRLPWLPWPWASSDPLPIPTSCRRTAPNPCPASADRMPAWMR